MLIDLEPDMRQLALRYDDVNNLLYVSNKMFSTNICWHIFIGERGRQ